MRGEMCASKRVKPIKWYVYFFIFYSSPFWFRTGLYDKTTARGAFSKAKRFGTQALKICYKKTTFVSDTYNKESPCLFSWHFYLQHLTIERPSGWLQGKIRSIPIPTSRCPTWTAFLSSSRTLAAYTTVDSKGSVSIHPCHLLDYSDPKDMSTINNYKQSSTLNMAKITGPLFWPANMLLIRGGPHFIRCLGVVHDTFWRVRPSCWSEPGGSSTAPPT